MKTLNLRTDMPSTMPFKNNKTPKQRPGLALVLTAILLGTVGWALWHFPSTTLQAASRPTAERLGRDVERARSEHPKAELFGLKVGDSEVGLAAIDREKAALQLFLVDRVGLSLALHEVDYKVTAAPEGALAVSADYRLVWDGKIRSTSRARWTLHNRGGRVTLEPTSENPGETPSEDPAPTASAASEPSGNSSPDQDHTAEAFPGLSAVFGEPDPSEAAKLGHHDTKASDLSPLDFPWPDPKLTSAKLPQLVFDPIRAALVARKTKPSQPSSATEPQAESGGASPAPQAQDNAQLVLAVRPGLDIHLSQLKEEQVKPLIGRLMTSKASLRLVSAGPSRDFDLERLQSRATDCSERMQALQKRSLRTLANVPFVLQRKVNLVLELCRETVTFAQKARSAPRATPLVEAMNQHVRSILRTPKEELPRALIQSTHWPVIFEDDLQDQWPRALTGLIESAVVEVEDSAQFEELRKVPVKLQVVLRGRSAGTVVKGVIYGKDLELSLRTEPARPATMLPTSLRAVADRPQTAALAVTQQQNAQNAASATRYWDGRYLFGAKDFAAEAETLCGQEGGRIGLDLGDAPSLPTPAAQEQPSTPSQQAAKARASGAKTALDLKGAIWDEAARLHALALFLRQAVAAESCRQVVVRAPESALPSVKLALNRFEAEVLQSNQELQLTNSRLRYLNMLPGRYEIFIHSLISGQLLERFEFDVKSAKKAQLVNLSVGQAGDVLPEDPAETD